MRLKHLFISEYKNLRDFELNFEDDNFLDIFVGKNGTGKSNLFEAIIEIFNHLHSFSDARSDINFPYKVSYEISEIRYDIEWTGTHLKLNGRLRRTNNRIPFPDHLLIYYSGHNRKIHDLIESYKVRALAGIRNPDITRSRYIYGVGTEYKETLLASILLKGEESLCRNHICDKLAISETGDEIKFTLTRPHYAQGNEAYDVQNNDLGDPSRFWRATGPIKIFLDKLVECRATSPEGRLRTEGYLADSDTYVLYVSLAALRDHFSTEPPHAFFNILDKLILLEMLGGVEVPLTLVGGVDANSSFFSDGQFQSVYIYAISEIFKERNCLSLLDEPDSFLHPEWQHQFLDQVHEISELANRTNHTLLTSHSAVTLIPHRESRVRYFELNQNRAHCYPLPKKHAISRLSSDLIKYSEQEQLLSIINAIQIENKPVLFTEGSTDPIILKEAWYKLHTEEMPFIPFYAFSCSFIKNLLTDNRIHSEMGGLPVFGLFDLDQAYNHWNGLNGTVIHTNPFEGLRKKWDGGDSYALIIPVPENEEIKRQSIRDEATNTTFEGGSLCEIEHLFYGHEQTESYFKKEPCAGGEKVSFISDTQKTHFARDVIPTLTTEAFEVFSPMFDFIKTKCPQPMEVVAR